MPEQASLKLTNRQLAFLRGLGQRLRPALHLGHAGHTEATQRALEELLEHRELVKVRVLPTTEASARDIAVAMAEQSRAALAGVVGRTFVVYRPNPELKDRLELPDALLPSREERKRP